LIKSDYYYKSEIIFLVISKNQLFGGYTRKIFFKQLFAFHAIDNSLIDFYLFPLKVFSRRVFKGMLNETQECNSSGSK